MPEETPKEETPKEETPKEETPKEETPKEETPKADPDWKGPFDEMSSKLDGLAASVAALAPLPNENPPEDLVPDENPVKPPWTHRSLFN